MKKCKCGGVYLSDLDRIVCTLCSHSIWDDFKIRRPTKDEQTFTAGRGIGRTANREYEGAEW